MRKSILFKTLAYSSAAVLITSATLGYISADKLDKNYTISERIKIDGLSHNVSYQGVLQLKAKTSFNVEQFE
jgi:hypothetical protein